MLVGVIVVAVVAALLPAMFWACAAGRIRRNPYLGIRLPALFASDAAWTTGHRAALVPTVIGSAVAVILGVVALAVPAFGTVGFAAETIALLAGVLVGTVLAVRAAGRISGEAE